MRRALTSLAFAAILLCNFSVAQAQPQSTTNPPPVQHKKPQTYVPGTQNSAADPQQVKPEAAAPEFDHVALHVRDLAKSSDFYQRVLGLVEIADPFRDGQHVFLRLGAHSQLHLVSDPPNVAAQALQTAQITGRDIYVHFALRVASVTDFAARLDRLKVPYRGIHNEPAKIAKRPDGVAQIYFQDPDGYWIEVNDDKY